MATRMARMATRMARTATPDKAAPTQPSPRTADPNAPPTWAGIQISVGEIFPGQIHAMMAAVEPCR
jgi:hypothetical protein